MAEAQQESSAQTRAEAIRVRISISQQDCREEELKPAMDTSARPRMSKIGTVPENTQDMGVRKAPAASTDIRTSGAA